MIELDDRSMEQYGAKIKVVGVGGGGSNAVNTMIERGLQGCEFVVANTDLQALASNGAPIKVQIGKDSTRGLGAGADPSVGRHAAQEDIEELQALLSGSDMVFVTAGMGGGTGTGAAPVIADVAHQMGALVVGVVTRPFDWEGKRRMQQAEEGIRQMKQYVDTLIVVPNQKLLAIIDKKTGLKESFQKVDDILYSATRGITEIITGNGFINVDFADVRAVMQDMGDALMGTGISVGEHRAIEAAESAISSPLLEGVSIAGSQGVLINIAASDLTMTEVDEAMQIVYGAVGKDGSGSAANIIFGVVLDESLEDRMMVTVIATGFNKIAKEAPKTETKTETVSQMVMNPAPVVQRSIQSTNVPVGPDELEKYEAPAYLRRNNQVQHGGFDITRLREQSAQQQVSQPAPEPEQAEEQPVRRQASAGDRPAFLRRIMD